MREEEESNGSFGRTLVYLAGGEQIVFIHQAQVAFRKFAQIAGYHSDPHMLHKDSGI